MRGHNSFCAGPRGKSGFGDPAPQDGILVPASRCACAPEQILLARMQVANPIVPNCDKAKMLAVDLVRLTRDVLHEGRLPSATRHPPPSFCTRRPPRVRARGDDEVDAVQGARAGLQAHLQAAAQGEAQGFCPEDRGRGSGQGGRAHRGRGPRAHARADLVRAAAAASMPRPIASLPPLVAPALRALDQGVLTWRTPRPRRAQGGAAAAKHHRGAGGVQGAGHGAPGARGGGAGAWRRKPAHGFRDLRRF